MSMRTNPRCHETTNMIKFQCMNLLVWAKHMVQEEPYPITVECSPMLSANHPGTYHINQFQPQMEVLIGLQCRIKIQNEG